MLPELSEIKALRKKLGLTQHALAKQSGVSQSLIAKIESNSIDPTYTKTKRVFEFLHQMHNKKKVKAKDVMKKQVIIARPKEKIAQVVSDMRKNDISQLPVLDGKQIIGIISEKSMLEALIDGKKKYVEEVMSFAPPAIATETDIEVISNLLLHFPIVVVVESGELLGVISKSDILETMAKMN